jgi:hypothetical protein
VPASARARALVAAAAGRVAIALKVAVLAHDLRLPEDEAVRLEEAAQVDVGEDARRRWVAGALKAIELDRRERVDGRELIDDEHRAARPQHPVHLGEHELRLAALFEQLRDDVDAKDLARERRERDCKRAGAGGNVEGALLPPQRQQAAQPLLRLRGAAVLQLRDELSRLAEALANGV